MNVQGDELARRLDRLVDGELSEVERREVLARLESDKSPDGWRRLALAFLESQCWREALGEAVGDGLSAARPALARPSRPRSRVVSLAASVALAFLAGWLARGTGVELAETRTPAGHVMVAVSTPNTDEPAASEALPGPPVAVASHAPVEADATVPDSEDPGVLDIRSEAALREWESQGYRVDRRERLVSVGFDDGREVQLPAREFRLRYVGDQTY